MIDGALIDWLTGVSRASSGLAPECLLVWLLKLASIGCAPPMERWVEDLKLCHPTPEAQYFILHADCVIRHAVHTADSVGIDLLHAGYSRSPLPEQGTFHELPTWVWFGTDRLGRCVGLELPTPDADLVLHE